MSAEMKFKCKTKKNNYLENIIFKQIKKSLVVEVVKAENETKNRKTANKSKQTKKTLEL